MSLYVLKFGGSVIGKLENIAGNLKIACDEARRYISDGHKCAIVVSAPAGVTRTLDGYCDALCIEKASRDFMAATGEIFSAGAVSGCLEKNGIPAQPFCAWNLVTTDDDFSNAKIEKVDIRPVKKCIDDSKIAVVTGYIGATEDGRPTTLPYDGSDISAVRFAIELKADYCILYKDVPGIYGDDGKHQINEKLYHDRLSFDDMIKISENGGNVLHADAVRMAKENNIPILVRQIGHPFNGTIIG